MDNVVGILEEILSVCKKLVDLNGQKKEALIKVNLPRLSTVNHELTDALSKLNILEQKRNEAVIVLVRNRNLEIVPSLTELKQIADADNARKLDVIKKELFDTTVRLFELNKINASLIGKALTHVQFNINLLTNAQSDSIYSVSASPHTTGGRKIFIDQKA